MLDSAFGSTTPSIVVGRALSDYFVGQVHNNQVTITYTVYNEQADDETGVLLTTTLAPGVTIDQASINAGTTTPLPDQQGQNLAWSLGTIEGYDRASVTLVVDLANSSTLQLDTGAKAYATLDAGAVSASTPAATLSAGNLSNPSLLASTPDANTTDPYIQEEAAVLDYSPQDIFNFLHTQIGYNSYTGSVRGARGTLWSNAGNALDVASLGVALMRASGIPAQYVSGTLSQSQAQQLILSMFPASYQTVGYIPAGTTTSDPADDSQLLSETENHYWFQFNTGTGFQNADPLMAGATIGQSFTPSTGTFTEVADNLRDKVEVQINAEIDNTAESLFGLSGISTTTVLDQTFNTVDLVGKTLSFGHLVSSQTIDAAVVTTTTNTYTPYMIINDVDQPDPTLDQIITGTPYQETLTSFPLGTEVVTGVFLTFNLTAPDASPQSYQYTMADRIGITARSNGGSSSISVSPGTSPLFSPDDVTTAEVLPGDIGTTVLGALANAAAPLETQYASLLQRSQSIAPDDPQQQVIQNEGVDLIRSALVAATASRLAEYFTLSQDYTDQFSSNLDTVTYYDSPRIAIMRLAANSNGASINTLTSAFDLTKDDARTIVYPSQNVTAGFALGLIRGPMDTSLETTAGTVTPNVSNLQTGTPFSAETAVDMAKAQGIPLVTLVPGQQSVLDTLNIPADAKTLIGQALNDGDVVITPAQSISIDGTARLGWYQINPTTGESVGVIDNGTHGLIDDVASYLVFVVQLHYAEFLWGFVVGWGIDVFAGFIRTVLEPTLDLLPKNLSSAAKKAKGLYDVALIYTAAQEESIKLALTLPAFALGLSLGLAVGLKGLYQDPPIPDSLIDPASPEIPIGNIGSNLVTQAVNTSAGAISGNVSLSSLQVSGQIEASWGTASSTSTFAVSSLSSSIGRVVDASGNVVATGQITLNTTLPTFLAISGDDQFDLSGTGSLSAYAGAESRLGVSSNWTNVLATVSGTVVLVLTTDGLVVDGQTLPAGRYTVTTSSASLIGDGQSSSPSFAGTLFVSATGASVALGRATGTVLVGGKPLDPETGSTLSGYTGSISLTANAGATDSATVQGNATEVLSIGVQPSTLSANQNTAVTFATNNETSLADTYTVTAVAPVGWTVTIDASGNVTADPAPGLPAGTYPIDVTSQSTTDPALVAQSIVEVVVSSTTPGIALSVSTDPIFTVPFNGADIPSAYQASIKNLGPAEDTYNLTFSNLPVGFTLQDSGTSATVPAGATGIVGLYLVPTAGSTLPAPGTVLTFQVTATSTSNPSITKTQTVTFTVPAIDAVNLTSNPTSLEVTPGVSVPDTITITNDGNVTESNIALAATTSTALTLIGLSPISLAVGQSATETVMITPSSSTPLNSILQATITATYGASAATQTLTLPVNVVVPGAQAIGNASSAASQLGETDLGDRLDDLSAAITNLVQNPSSLIYRNQSITDVNAITTLVGDDPFLGPLATTLSGNSNALLQASTASSVQTALSALSSTMTTLNNSLNDEIEHNFTLSLQTNSQVAQPQAPLPFTIVLQNTGDSLTKYDLSISGLPAGVTASFSASSITLGAGDSTTDPGGVSLTVTLTSTSSTSLPAFTFTVTATVVGASEITRSTTGSLTARPDLVSVVSVSTNPPFTDPGGMVDVSARVLNAVNQSESANFSFVVTNAANQTLYTSTPVTASLDVLTTLTTVDLGSFSTAGFTDGIDTITVLVTTSTGTPIPGSNATGSLQVGSPVTATESVSPDSLPIGSGTVTNSVTVALDPNATAPLSLIGQLDPSGGASSVVVDGTDAYVGGSGVITIVDVSNPSQPTAIGSFGSSELTGTTVTSEVISGNDLYVLVNNTSTSTSNFLIYSLANPLSPTLLGQTSLGPDIAIEGFVLSNDHAYFYGHWLRYYYAGNTVFQQHGEILSVDVTNPADPVDTGIVYNDPPDSGSGFPDGDSYMFSELAVNSDTLLAASTSATMSTLTGTGEVLVINTATPSTPALTRTLDIPGTTLIVSMVMESGNRALLLASTGGFIDGDTDTDSGGSLTFGPSGNLVLVTLDLSNPQDPQILSTQQLTRSSRESDVIRLYAVGGDKFVLGSLGATTDQPNLMFIDASGSGDAVVTTLTIPAVSYSMYVSGNNLYTTSTSGLSIYNIGQGAPQTPITVDVQVPNNTGVSIVPSSFNVAPASITTGTNFDTIEWNLTLDQATTTETFTYQTAVTGLEAGESLQVTGGTTISFNSQGTSSSFGLAPMTVSGQQFIGIFPSSNTTAPGQAASYYVRLENPTASSVTYDLTLNGVPSSWSNLPATEVVPAGGENDFYFNLTPTATTSPVTFGFSITASTVAGAAGSASSSLIVQGQPVVLDSQTHGIVATLTPVEATAGRGTSAQYVVQLTNTGSTPDTYTLQFESTQLAGEVSAVFGETTIEIPPGVSNFRDVPLTLTALGGATPISGSFSIVAQLASNSAVSSTASGTLNIVASGVTEAFNNASIAPGGTFQLTVTNTGSATDTFDLSLGGPAALVATLGLSKVTLAPGSSKVVPITTSAVYFAVQGGLGLTAIATSETNTAVKADANASVAIPAMTGMSAQLTPATQLLPIPGATSFLLVVHNTGNVEDSYSATLTGTNGPIQANLVGLDGSPTDSIPTFILPGLSTGEIVVQADLTGVGQGTIGVQVTSLSNPSLSATETATVVSKPAATVPSATTLAISGPSTPVAFGQAVAIVATLTTASGAPSPTGVITFDVDGVEMVTSPIQVVNGVAQAVVSLSQLSSGVHEVLATYAGNSALASSTSGLVLATVNPPVVVATDGPRIINVQRYGYHSLPTSFVITFNSPLDPARAQDIANYRIVGPAGVLEPIKKAVYNATLQTVTLYPTTSLDLHAIYQLTIVGTGPDGIADPSGDLLDGSDIGLPGSNYTGLLEASQLVLGSTVPGGPAQLTKLRRELSQIETNQSKELAKEKTVVKKAVVKKAAAKVVKKAAHPVAKASAKPAKHK